MASICFCYSGAVGPQGAPGISNCRLVSGGGAGGAGGAIVSCSSNEVGLGCSSACGKTSRPDLRTCKDLCGYGGGYSKHNRLTLVCCRVGDNGNGYGHGRGRGHYRPKY